MLGLSIRTALFDCELQITVRDYLANSVSDLYIRICLGEILAAKAKVHVCMAWVPPWYLEPFAMLVVLSSKKRGVRTFCTLLTFQKYQRGKLGSHEKLPSCGLQIADRDLKPIDQAHRGKAGFDVSVIVDDCWWLRMISWQLCNNSFCCCPISQFGNLMHSKNLQASHVHAPLC